MAFTLTTNASAPDRHDLSIRAARAFSDAFTPALLVGAALSAAGIVAALLVPGVSRSRRPARERATAPDSAGPVYEGATP